MGYPRPDGRAGTRNYLAVISTVNCSAFVVSRIAAYFTPERLAAYPNVDGVLALIHHTGCSIPLEGQAYEYLQRCCAMWRAVPHRRFGGGLKGVTRSSPVLR
jgi:altronate hydrolase